MKESGLKTTLKAIYSDYSLVICKFVSNQNFDLEKLFSKYFWKAGSWKLLHVSCNTEYISLAVNLSNAITLVFFIK